MGKKFILLAIICLLIVTAGGCSKKTTSPASAPVAGLRSQQTSPVTTVANPPTTLPPPAATGQTTTNQAPAPTTASDTERQLNQQIAGALYGKVKMPVLMPSYWPPIPPSNNQNPYCGLQYSAGPDSFSVSITVVSKQLPVNSPELNMPPNDAEANQWGNFGCGRIGAPGVAAPNAGVVQKPKDGEPSVISGYQGW